MRRLPASLSVLLASLLPGLSGALGGCRTEAEAPVAAVSVSPAESAAVVKDGLMAAHRAWSAGDRAAAEAGVRAAYADGFEPLEPALHARDAMATLQLEYAFGSLARTLSRKGDPVEVAAQVNGLVAAVEAAAAALPAPAPPAPAPEPAGE